MGGINRRISYFPTVSEEKSFGVSVVILVPGKGRTYGDAKIVERKETKMIVFPLP